MIDGRRPPCRHSGQLEEALIFFSGLREFVERVSVSFK